MFFIVLILLGVGGVREGAGRVRGELEGGGGGRGRLLYGDDGGGWLLKLVIDEFLF